jgi:two-component system LytT family sensor kinase
MGEHSTLEFRQVEDVAELRKLSGYWLAQVGGWSAFAVITFLTLAPIFPAAIPRLAATKFARAALGLVASDVLYRLYRSFRPGPWMAGAVYVVGTLWYVAFAFVTSIWQPPGTPGIDWRQVPHLGLDSVVVLAAWSFAYAGIRSWRRADAADRAAERAQLDALRYQLNPHFLFNALSSIRALILEDPRRARAMVTGFADLLRQSLDGPTAGDRLLKDEIATMAQYLAIEQERFGASLDVMFDVESSAGECSVPAFVLHPLVENAITHGRRTSSNPLRVRIHADATSERLRIEVANTGRLTPDASHRPVGVSSVRDRLAILYRDRQRLSLIEENGWVRAIIEIDARRP